MLWPMMDIVDIIRHLLTLSKKLRFANRQESRKPAKPQDFPTDSKSCTEHQAAHPCLNQQSAVQSLFFT